ncbi:hypothetical protein RHSIM_Rhsim10G0176800 [Rhododendron simsii]|uniref:Glabrous enhancer-binding protein-like DBD domain-containing protein n=1 Tax=Rhododendron simsii TaxID=118357 RepID=A0A834GBY7_RHOSS|nr:hypothetical protein RHSIM_Rhsim10G0176800 [Rhododendron simsii]
MDSTPNPNPNPNLSLKSKLPIKRKISEPNPNPNLAPKLEHLSTAITGDGEYDGGDGRQPPFKFHRIWTEPDEIRFLQCLLDSTDLSFPRDLNLFYSRFSSQTATSHPYNRSQLYEKLRRLRKKFRVVSSRLARGLHRAVLSPHDRALFDLSKRLWHPDFSSASPFAASGGGGNSRSSKQKNNKKSNLVGVRSLKEVRTVLVSDLGSDGLMVDGLEKQWSEQRVAELDVLGRRLRLLQLLVMSLFVWMVIRCLMREKDMTWSGRTVSWKSWYFGALHVCNCVENESLSGGGGARTRHHLQKVWQRYWDGRSMANAFVVMMIDVYVRVGQGRMPEVKPVTLKCFVSFYEFSGCGGSGPLVLARRYNSW